MQTAINWREASGKTAIRRTTPSAPLIELATRELLPGRGKILDFGCGHGADVATLKQLSFRAEGWDPVHHPEPPPEKRGRFDLVLCTYVLNTLPIEDEAPTLERIRQCLKPGGVAYITVRADLEREGWTSKGTFQRDVHLDLPVKINKLKAFRTYEMCA